MQTLTKQQEEFLETHAVFERGYAAGVRWAKKKATPGQLNRLRVLYAEEGPEKIFDRLFVSRAKERLYGYSEWHTANWKEGFISGAWWTGT
jgi:hypothetical protein